MTTNPGGSRNGKWGQSSVGNSAFSNEASATPSSGGQTPFGGTPWPVPGLIQAENSIMAARAWPTTTPAPKTRAGNTAAPAWIFRQRLTPAAATTSPRSRPASGSSTPSTWRAAGTYTLDLRVASNGAGGTFRVESDGVNKTGTLTVPNTGGWQKWTTISVTVQLSAGQHVLRVAFDTVGATGYTGNFNWLKLTAN